MAQVKKARSSNLLGRFGVSDAESSKLRASRATLGKEGAVELAQKEHWALVQGNKRVVRGGSRTGVRCDQKGRGDRRP
jgi:hypothetical protein